MRQVVATELKRSPALLALDLTEVNRQTATRKRQNGARDRPPPVRYRHHRIIQQRNGSGVQSVHLSACNVPAQLLTQVTSQRLAQPCHLLQRRIVDRLTQAPQHRAQLSLQCAPDRAFIVAWLRAGSGPPIHPALLFRHSPRCRYGRRRRVIRVQGRA